MPSAREGASILNLDPVEFLFLLHDGSVDPCAAAEADGAPTTAAALAAALHAADGSLAAILAVYTELRREGYFPRPAVRHGGHLSLYQHPSPKLGHASHIVFICRAERATTAALLMRTATNTRKRVLLATVRGPRISFLELSHKRL
eukprot:gnl/Chilomastix_cuspidata/6420.p2 GENE.gnl/Chilomastix_cuspidata/6420~~gnl/Chilomastix_cuspidata/6420.p2  ORF type:complete len:146 (-),score=41.47 gnl/Chilomastix_cuspidata/6420:27-464(-)